MDLQRNLLESSRTCSTKQKKAANTHTQPLWSIEIHLSMEPFSHQCKILQVRQAHTDLPLLHAAKVQMGIKHAPQPTAEILHVKDELLSSPQI